MNQKTLHIAIDGNEANVSQRVGSNQYAFQLLSAMAEQLRARADISVTVLLSQKPMPDFPREHKRWKYRIFGPKAFWTQWALPVHLWLHASEYDVFFTPGHYAPRWSAVPYVSSVMDLAFLHYPHQFRKKDYLQLKHWTKYSVKSAKKVVTISQFSKQEIEKYYGLKPSQIVVAYPAIEKWEQVSQSTIRKVQRKFRIETPFWLYVGTLQPRKNVTTLVKAFELLWQQAHKKDARDLPQQLVIAGKVGWLADELLEQIKNSPVKKRIVLTGYVTEAEKKALLSSATGFSLLGLYEGFGIPALEALQAGTPVVVSNTSSLPEVVGSAGFLVDPASAEKVAKKMREVTEMSAGQLIKLKKQMNAQVSHFNWVKSAEIVIETLENVIAKKSS